MTDSAQYPPLEQRAYDHGHAAGVASQQVDYAERSLHWEDALRKLREENDATQVEIERLTEALTKIATFHGEMDLPEELQNGSAAAIRFYAAVEPIRIARAALAALKESPK